MADIWWCLIQIPGKFQVFHLLILWIFSRSFGSFPPPHWRFSSFYAQYSLGTTPKALGKGSYGSAPWERKCRNKNIPMLAFVSFLKFGSFPCHLFITHTSMLFLCLRVLEELIVNRFMYIKTLESVSICTMCVCCVGEDGWVSFYCAWLLKSDQGTCSMLQRVPIGKYGLSESLSVPPDSMDFSMILPLLWCFASNRIRYGQWFSPMPMFHTKQSIGSMTFLSGSFLTHTSQWKSHFKEGDFHRNLLILQGSPTSAASPK